MIQETFDYHTIPIESYSSIISWLNTNLAHAMCVFPSRGRARGHCIHIAILQSKFRCVPISDYSIDQRQVNISSTISCTNMRLLRGAVPQLRKFRQRARPAHAELTNAQLICKLAKCKYIFSTKLKSEHFSSLCFLVRKEAILLRAFPWLSSKRFLDKGSKTTSSLRTEDL